MTENQNAPSGWYDNGSGSLRWWNGVAWTEHVAPQHAPPQQQANQSQAAAPQLAQQDAVLAQRPVAPQQEPLQRPQIAPDTPVDSVWTWLIALLPFITVPLIFTYDFRSYLIASTMNDMSVQFGFIAWQLIISFVSLILTAFLVIAAWRDHRTLQSRGVVRPFHWAFSLLGGIVYLIGRHVVLRKVCRTPGWPLWVFLALEVVTLIVISVWTTNLVRTAIEMATYYGPIG